MPIEALTAGLQKSERTARSEQTRAATTKTAAFHNQPSRFTPPWRRFQLTPCSTAVNSRRWTIGSLLASRYQALLSGVLRRSHIRGNRHLARCSGKSYGNRYSPCRQSPSRRHIGEQINAAVISKFRRTRERFGAYHAVIYIYDVAGNVIETHERKGDFNEW